MLKKFAAAALLLLTLAPAAKAEVVTGKIQLIDTDNSMVTIQTTDGGTQVYRYAPDTLEIAKLTEGSDVRVSPMKTGVGTVVRTFRNYVQVRPDSATETGAGEFIAIPQGPQKFQAGDRVLILSRCKLVETSEEVVGYLIPGDIVPEVKLAELQYSTPQPVTIERPTAGEAQPVIEQPAEVVEPVRALW